MFSSAYELGLHTVFTKLTDPTIRGRADESELLEKGRCWLVVYVYSHLYVLLLAAQETLLMSETDKGTTAQQLLHLLGMACPHPYLAQTGHGPVPRPPLIAIFSRAV
jgi:hypothetical protein